MDFSSILPFIHTIISFVVILSLIVFIHEFGHYIVARWCGVKVEEFSIGFGKELFGWNAKSGTRWKICLIPMGGYVKMFGDASEASTPDSDTIEKMTEEEREVSFHYKSLPRKAAIVFAGPLANFLLTILIFTGFIFTNGLSTTDPVIGEVMPASAAEEAGLQSGDLITFIDGEAVESFSDIPRMIAINLGEEAIEITINRDGNSQIVKLIPKMDEAEDRLGNKVMRPLIGIKSQKMKIEDVGIARAIGESVKQTYNITVLTLKYIGQLVVGDRSADELKGPIGIAKLSGQAADQGLTTILWFMAMLSANLGMVNLFPIPPLDGGHLLFYTIEGARGRPMAEKIQNIGYRVGFALILTLMAFTIYNDVKSLFV